MARQRGAYRIGPLLGKAARIAGPRLLVLGGLTLLALLLLGELRWVVPGRTAAIPVGIGDEDADPVDTGPGWPHLRGPYHDSTTDAEELADRWPAAGPPVLWTREIGIGYSGFTAVGRRVFTQRQTLYGQSVLCLDADRGEPVWEYRYGWPYDSAGMYPGPRATPTWHEDRVYFAAPDGLVGCLDARDGRLLWSRNVNQDFGGRGTDFGYSASPTIEDGKVILPVGGPGASVVALDVQDGSTVWASGDEPASYCCARPITFGGQRLLVLFMQNSLALLEPQAGRWLWQQRFSGGYDERAAMPLYQEPYLMVAHPFRGGADVFEIQAGETVTVQRVRTIAKMSNDVASSILIDGRVYGFDLREPQSKARRPSRGEFRCVDLASGEVLWSTDRVGHASVIHADGKLILFNDRGELLLARPAADGYHELARAQIFEGEICWTAPALHRGRLYLRSPTRAACVYLGAPAALAADQAAHARPAGEIQHASSFDTRWLVGGERTYPADFPTRDELVRWYFVILLGAMIPAAILAAVCRLLAGWFGRDHRALSQAVFWTALFVAGIALTPLGNALAEPFIFTWPLCLFVGQHAVLAAVIRSRRQTDRDAVPWIACVATLAFFATCLVYFHFCRRLDLAVGWVFLLGFLPSWPVAVPVAWRLKGSTPLFTVFGGAAIAFTAFYWAVGAYVLLAAC